MKIVLDIPETLYLNVKNEILLCYGSEKVAIEVTKAFQNCVVLSDSDDDENDNS